VRLQGAPARGRYLAIGIVVVLLVVIIGYLLLVNPGIL
jgi:hypothetical protein